MYMYQLLILIVSLGRTGKCYKFCYLQIAY